jgi:nitrous oxidase accessory protein NosD/nitrous oxide reductase accessory protein NosL
MIHVRYAAIVVALALLLTASGFAAGPAGESQFSPVPFDRALATGMTGVDVDQASAQGYAIPKGEVFYSQYEYVVGYYGIESLVAGLGAERTTEQFGQPLATFVTDLDGTDPSLTEEGYITLNNTLAEGWIQAEDALFVVDSGARTPAGETVVSFGSRETATRFADEYGGEVVDWETLTARQRAEPATDSADAGPIIRDRQAWADDAVETAVGNRGRPVSVVVGENASSLEAAVEKAPAGTAIEIPPGRYEVNVTVNKTLTIRGAGANTVLDGGGNGSVLTVRAPDAVVRSLRITGVGDVGIRRSESEGEAWDERIRLIYGRGDAGIRLADAPRSLVEDVTIETPTNGVVALNSSNTAIRNVTVDGAETWQEGFMGILAMYSRVVVEDSTVEGGRDGVYTHYSDGIVVRDNRMSGLRYGVHEMYTSDILVANNTVREANTGIILMTRPAGNVLADNDIRDSDLGIATVGAASYITGNVIADNEVGVSMSTSRSVYTRNTVVRNGVGLRSATLLPTNRVAGNDVVANDRPVKVGRGTLKIWATDGRGNYWGRVPGLDRDGDGVVDRSFRPASGVDTAARPSGAGYALAHSPTVGALRQFQGAVPGLRQSGIVDPAPLTDPIRPDTLAELNVTASEP